MRLLLVKPTSPTHMPVHTRHFPHVTKPTNIVPTGGKLILKGHRLSYDFCSFHPSRDVIQMWTRLVSLTVLPTILRSRELRTQKLKSHLVGTQSLNVLPLKLASSRSVYSHTCYAYRQEFLPCLFLPFRSIHLHFFQTSPNFSRVSCG